MKDEVGHLLSRESEARILEKTGIAVRSVYGCHVTSRVFEQLARHRLILGPAKQILRGDAYIYQFKINIKAALVGDIWQWHQDFIFWREEDGLPGTEIVNIVVFIDSVNEFNAPLYLIPGSHKEGVIEIQPRQSNTGDGMAANPSAEADWLPDVAADLKYALNKGRVQALAEKYGLAAPKGPAGSVLIFDSRLVHASPGNISPFDRALAFVTFCRTDNIPSGERIKRPDFLVGRDYSPVEPASDIGSIGRRDS